MLAKIEALGTDDAGSVTVTVGDGRGLSALFTEQEISVVENTTGLGAQLAEHVAGVAWAVRQDEGSDRIPWKRLLGRAERSMKDFEAARLRMN